jgi:hypothetical protein
MYQDWLDQFTFQLYSYDSDEICSRFSRLLLSYFYHLFMDLNTYLEKINIVHNTEGWTINIDELLWNARQSVSCSQNDDCKSVGVVIFVESTSSNEILQVFHRPSTVQFQRKKPDPFVSNKLNRKAYNTEKLNFLETGLQKDQSCMIKTFFVNT